MKPLHWILLLALNIGTLLLHFLGPEHPHPHAWDVVPLFYAIFGFTGCVVIIIVAKTLGKLLLQRGEDYYDRDS